MIINYWDCKYHDYDEFWDGETEARIYGCSHTENKDCYCGVDNKWGGEKAECHIAELEE